MKWIIRLLFRVATIIILSYLMSNVELQGAGSGDGFITALIFAVVLSFLNTFLKPILSFFSLPITFITFGIFQLVVNTFVVLIADKLVDGFQIDGFLNALLFTVVFSIISSAIENIVTDKK
jgi:putative membrane protein